MDFNIKYQGGGSTTNKSTKVPTPYEEFVRLQQILSRIPGLQKKIVGNEIIYTSPTTSDKTSSFVLPKIMMENQIQHQKHRHIITGWEGNIAGAPNSINYAVTIVPKPTEVKKSKDKTSTPKVINKKVIVEEKPQQLKMVSNRISIDPFGFGTPSITRQPIIQPNQSGDYTLRFSELNSEGQNQPRELFFKTRKEADDMMDFLQKQNDRRYETGRYYNNLSTQGNYQLPPYRKGGRLSIYQGGGPYDNLDKNKSYSYNLPGSGNVNLKFLDKEGWVTELPEVVVKSGERSLESYYPESTPTDFLNFIKNNKTNNIARDNTFLPLTVGQKTAVKDIEDFNRFLQTNPGLKGNPFAARTIYLNQKAPKQYLTGDYRTDWERKNSAIQMENYMAANNIDPNMSQAERDRNRKKNMRLVNALDVALTLEGGLSLGNIGLRSGINLTRKYAPKVNNFLRGNNFTKNIFSRNNSNRSIFQSSEDFPEKLELQLSDEDFARMNREVDEFLNNSENANFSDDVNNTLNDIKGRDDYQQLKDRFKKIDEEGKAFDAGMTPEQYRKKLEDDKMRQYLYDLDQYNTYYKRGYGDMIEDRFITEDYVRNFNKNFSDDISAQTKFIGKTKKEIIDNFIEQTQKLGKSADEVDPDGFIRGLMGYPGFERINWKPSPLGFQIYDPQAMKESQKQISQWPINLGGREIKPNENFIQVYDKSKRTMNLPNILQNGFWIKNKRGGKIK